MAQSSLNFKQIEENTIVKLDNITGFSINNFSNVAAFFTIKGVRQPLPPKLTNPDMLQAVVSYSNFGSLFDVEIDFEFESQFIGEIQATKKIIIDYFTPLKPCQ